MYWNAPEHYPPARMLEAARALASWTPFEVAAATDAFEFWCERTLSQEPLKSRASADSVVDVMRRVRSIRNEHEIDEALPGTLARWAALESLLELRIGRAESLQHELDPQKIWGKKYVADTLGALNDAPLAQRDLQFRLRIGTPSGASHLIGMLEAAGLVASERSSGDARARIISITAAGRELLREKRPAPTLTLVTRRNILSQSGVVDSSPRAAVNQ